MQWSFDIQRELPSSTILTVGYVGSKTSHIDNTIPNFNSPPPSTNTDFNSRRPWQAYVSRGEGNQARLLGNIRYLDSFANANYNALQVQAQKRYWSWHHCRVSLHLRQGAGRRIRSKRSRG